MRLTGSLPVPGSSATEIILSALFVCSMFAVAAAFVSVVVAFRIARAALRAAVRFFYSCVLP